MRSPELKYKRRRDSYERLQKKQSKIIARISNLRLLSFVCATTFIILAIAIGYYILFGTLAAVSFGLFIYLVIKHDKFIKSRQSCTLLLNINEDSLKRLKGEWSDFQDTGKDFADDSHPYTQDLDIFGSNSLFQMINTAVSYKGRHALKQLLAGRPDCAESIYKRQQAVSELALKLGWRQRFQAEALTAAGNMSNPEELVKWAGNFNAAYRNPWLIAIVKTAPAATLLLCVLSFALHLIPFYIPVITLLAQFAAVTVKRRKRHSTFSIADKYANDINVYYKMLRRIEKQQFKSSCLQKSKESMNNNEGLCPSRQLDRLSRIIDSMSNRHTPFYVIFNTLILWDFQNIIALEKWKETSGRHIESWLNTVSDFEALSSLSILSHDNPDWVMPVFAESAENSENEKDGKAAAGGYKAEFEAKSMGHPLLSLCKVNNDLHISDPEKTLLITGSNMSGKSTLLRTAGINLVLAYSGAPVCAAAFRATIMDIYTCMRVSDNLGKSISSFYAELLRIKTVVSEAEAGGKVFFLLDEIFKGTNSKDRHTGARILINKLSNTKAIGLVSTHDLELCSLENENPKIRNYHFQESYKDNKICFDYKLRAGASTTSNAIYLMKMAGIDIEE